MEFMTLLILAFLFIILPIVLIVLIFLFRAGGEKEDGDQDQEQESDQNAHRPADLEEIARLWHDPFKGELVVEIGERTFRNLDDLDLDQYRRLAEAYDDLSEWFAASTIVSPLKTVAPTPAVHVEFSPEPSAQFAAHPEPSKQVDVSSEPSEQIKVPLRPSEQVEIPPPPEQTPQVSAALSVEEPRRNSLPPAHTSDADEFVRPSMNPMDIFARALRPSPETKVPEVNVVAQIDTILQENLEGTPLKKRGIRLAEKPDQAMVVKVGLDEYDSVDEVPDEQIRNVIQQAVSEWEDHMLGSLGKS